MKLIENCKIVYPFFKDVSIDEEKLHHLIDKLMKKDIPLPTWKNDFCFNGDPERTLDWIFLFNAINFSYWNSPRWFTKVSNRIWGLDDEAFGVMAALAHTMQSGVPLQDYKYVQTLEPSDLAYIFAPAEGAGKLPLVEERYNSLLELTQAFYRFGNAAGIMRMCKNSAPKIAAFLVSSCPSWNDVQHYQEVALPFQKRAWLCTAMLYERFIQDIDRKLVDWEQIPVFADYRLPQALRDLGILRYSPQLAELIDTSTPIPENSCFEIEIRATTIIVADRLYQSLPHLSALQLDAFLWTYAVQKDDSIAPHHRTRTIRY